MNDRLAVALRVYTNIRKSRRNHISDVILLEEWTTLEPPDLDLEQRAWLVISQEARVFAAAKQTHEYRSRL